MNPPADPASFAWRIAPNGDRCLIVEFGDAVDRDINARARTFADRLAAAGLDGITDIAPAFTTVAVHYRPDQFRDAASPALAPHAVLRRSLEALLADDTAAPVAEARCITVPVRYGGEFGADLDEVAAACGISAAEVIARHAASPHVVYMLGFAPGFPYIGGLDPRLAMPRRATPRTHVPAGSVAIARDQTAIYPIDTPGGWNLIGRTDLRLFDLNATTPCLLRPGDEIRFVAVPANGEPDAAA